MQRFGLLGYPIAHSLSPSLFKAGYDGRYDYELVEQADFDTAWRIFLKRYQAVNVTAPFKELAFEKAKIRSRECELIGAANILVQTPKGVSAWNSDCTGVAALLRKAFGGDHCLDGRNCLVVGAGGAGLTAGAAGGIAAAAAAPQGVHHPDGQEDRHGGQHRHAGQAQDLAQQPLAPGVPILLILHRDILSLRQSGDAGQKAGAIHPAEFSQLFIVTETAGKVKSFAAFRESMGIS